MIRVNGIGIALDRREQGADVSFVSHAHSDHIAAVRRAAGIFASKETIELVDAAYGIKVSNACTSGPGSSMQLFDSGHMLGAKQLAVTDETHGTRTVYSVDFQMQKSAASPQLEVTDADVLIIDSTYPYPNIRFDNRQEVEEELVRWVNRSLRTGSVLFSAYAMGKAQELTRLLNNAGIRPRISRKIGRINAVYEANGIRLECDPLYSQEGGLAVGGGSFVGIVENSELRELAYLLARYRGMNVMTAVATGFAKIFKFSTDAQFALSDHADFAQSVDYIEATGAKKVLAYGTNERRFAKKLAEHGYDAMPFSEAPANLFDGGFGGP